MLDSLLWLYFDFTFALLLLYFYFALLWLCLMVKMKETHWILTWNLILLLWCNCDTTQYVTKSSTGYWTETLLSQLFWIFSLKKMLWKMSMLWLSRISNIILPLSWHWGVFDDTQFMSDLLWWSSFPFHLIPT